MCSRTRLLFIVIYMKGLFIFVLLCSIFQSLKGTLFVEKTCPAEILGEERRSSNFDSLLLPYATTFVRSDKENFDGPLLVLFYHDWDSLVMEELISLMADFVQIFKRKYTGLYGVGLKVGFFRIESNPRYFRIQSGQIGLTMDCGKSVTMYQGSYEVLELMKFVEMQIIPNIYVVSPEDKLSNVLLESKTNFVVLKLQETSKESKTYEGMLELNYFTIPDTSFCHSTGNIELMQEVEHLLGEKLFGENDVEVILFDKARNVSKRYAPISMEKSPIFLSEWLEMNTVPLIQILSSLNFQHIYNQERPFLILLHHFNISAENLRTYEQIAASKQEYTFTILNTKRFQEFSRRLFGEPVQYSEVRIALVAPNQDRHYLFTSSTPSIQQDEIDSFFQRFESNSLEPFYFNSEPKNSESPLIGHSFQTLTKRMDDLNFDETLVLFFHTEYCTYCTVYQRLLEKIASTISGNIEFGTLNIQWNDVPEKIKANVTYSPSLWLFNDGSAHEYEGDYDYHGIIRWIVVNTEETCSLDWQE